MVPPDLQPLVRQPALQRSRQFLMTATLQLAATAKHLAKAVTQCVHWASATAS